MSITSIDFERSKRAGYSTGSHAADQLAQSAPKPPEYNDLAVTIGKLRSFSLLLCLNTDLADRLVETTLVRAGVCMSPSRLGLNTIGWLCGRLRSYYYSEFIGRQRDADLDGGDLPPPFSHVQGAARDLLNVIATLPAEQREALVLTEGMGFSRIQAARISSTPMHIFKVRLEEARAQLAMVLSVRSLSVIHDDMARYVPPARHLQVGLA